MSHFTQEERFKEIIKLNGKDAQSLEAIEEMASLTKVILKDVHGHKYERDYYMNKIADVQILLNQLKMIHDIDREELKELMVFKARRSYNRALKLNGPKGKDQEDKK